MADLFENLTEKEREKLINLAERRKYKAGDIIIKEKEKGRELFYITSGKVEIAWIRSKKVKEKFLIILSSKDTFGELSFIDGKERSSDVIAETDVEVLVFDEKKLKREMEKDKKFGAKLLLNLSRIISFKLKNTNQILNLLFS